MYVCFFVLGDLIKGILNLFLCWDVIKGGKKLIVEILMVVCVCF